MKNPFRKLGVFFGEVVGELRKATWPTPKECRHYVAVVLIGMALLGSYVAMVDFSLIQVVDLFSNWMRGALG
ncbi:MAG: preprotein translocase subunit SecE [Verrucomicrobiota bacterium]|nr:MAG: preprotein translocase subunit SecE [Verrucomicrobiota bacterium]